MHPIKVDQFLEVKVIQSGYVYYWRPEVRDNKKEAAALQYFHGQVIKHYVTK
jgi:hypothetical protein